MTSPTPESDRQTSPVASGVSIRGGKGRAESASGFTAKAGTKTRLQSSAAAGAFRTADRADLWQRLQSNVYDPSSPVGETRQKVMAGILVLSFAVFIAVAWNKLNSTHGPADLGGADETAAASLSKDSVIRWQEPGPYPKTLRDPMVLGTSGFAGEGPGLPLRGIIYSEQRCSAIIGSRIVHQGDKIQNATVVRINKDSVEFELNGKTWTQKIR